MREECEEALPVPPENFQGAPLATVHTLRWLAVHYMPMQCTPVSVSSTLRTAGVHSLVSLRESIACHTVAQTVTCYATHCKSHVSLRNFTRSSSQQSALRIVFCPSVHISVSYVYLKNKKYRKFKLRVHDPHSICNRPCNLRPKGEMPPSLAFTILRYKIKFDATVAPANVIHSWLVQLKMMKYDKPQRQMAFAC